jgi:RAQPRD family integrative conjugative element protein
MPVTVWVVALAASVSAFPAGAESPAENAQLAALLRQLDAIERIATASAQSAESGGRTRYHFDYARLRADLARIRAGIDDYLQPQRAQPRDPDTLIGEYRRETPAP